MSEVLRKCGFDSTAKVKLALLMAGVKLSAQDCVDAIMAYDGPGRIKTHNGRLATGAPNPRSVIMGGVGGGVQPALSASDYDFDDYEHQQAMGGFFTSDACFWGEIPGPLE